MTKMDKANDTVNTGVPLRLVGEDGNAFSILGRASKALRRAGKSDLWPGIEAEATSGDYNNLLRTMLKYFDVDADFDNEEDN